MARNSDDLVEHLISSLAIAGFRGLTVNDLARSISSFYHGAQDEASPTAPSGASTANPGVVVDRALLSKVWSWLGRHPDVSIGDGGRYNATPLCQVEAEFPGYLELEPEAHGPAAEDNPNTDDDSLEVGMEPKKQSKIRSSRATVGPRIRLNEEQLYEAICGHPRDPRRVPPLEFELLHRIAARGADGLLQGELVRLSGQDKRSVPKRTDALHKKGYIFKEVVFKRGNQTSRLTLKKFAKVGEPEAEPAQHHGPIIRHVVRRIFDILTDQDLIPQNILAENLNLQSSAQSAALQKVIRRLEKLKLVKRVRTATGPSATPSDLQTFVQLLHRAEPEDLEKFNNEKLSLDQTLDELAAGEDSEGLPTTSTQDTQIPDETQDPLTALYRPPIWNPDRLMPNVLVEAVDAAGARGFTNLHLRQIVTGDFLRRQLEAVLHRVCCESLVVQPPHLRHLAIIRRDVTENGATKYIHYSWNELRNTMAAHDLDLSGIPGAQKALDSQPEEADRLGADGTAPRSTNTDEFGFPVQIALPVQVRGGEATFQTLVRAATAGDVEVRKEEFVLAKNGTDLVLDVRDELPASVGGTDQLPLVPQRRRPVPSSRRKSKRKRASIDGEEVVRGRPRKYMRGTERFWRMQVKQARLDPDTDEEETRKSRREDTVLKALHALRPLGFDETLVEALHAELPLPVSAEEIDEAWMNSTRHVLDRVLKGVYMSPLGLRGDNFRRLSRVMIIKTPKLASIDFSDTSRIHQVRFISSSASHSFAYRRYYPNLSVNAPRLRRGPPGITRHEEDVSDRNNKEKKGGPRLGIFYEDAVAATTPSFESENTIQYEVPLDISYDTTDEEAGPLYPKDRRTRRSTTISVEPVISSERVQTRQDSEEAAALRDNCSSLETTTAPPDLSTRTPPVRSSRRRKLTEKAVQLLETNQGRNMRLFSETRSLLSAESTTEKIADTEIALNAGQASRERTETAAAVSSSPLVSAQASDGDTQVPVENSTFQDNSTAPNNNPALDNSTAQDNSLSNEVSSKKGESVAPPNTAATPEPPKQQTATRQKYTKGANALCRKIVVQLVEITNGVAPSDAHTMRRISANRWQEYGESGGPLLKAIKGAVKSLCASNRLKQDTFSFRAKSGVMITRSVVFLPDIRRTSQYVEDVKQKIIGADGIDYIPPQWNAEAVRTPLVNRVATPEVEEPPARRRRASSTVINKRPAKRERASSAASDGSVGSAVTRSTRSQSAILHEPTLETANTGYLTLQVPSLRSLPIVKHHEWSNECPVLAARSDESIGNPWRPWVDETKSRRRRTRKPTSQSTRKSIVWQNFPSSVKDILKLPRLKLSFADVVSEDRDWQRFACEVEGVRAWEEQDPESALSKRSKYAFINHTVPEGLYSKADLPATIEFEALVSFDQDGSELESAYPSVLSWPAFVTALQTSPKASSQIAGVDDEVPQVMPPPPTPVASTTGGLRRTSRAPKPKIMQDNVFFDPALEEALEPEPQRGKKGKITEDNVFFDPALEEALESAPKRRKKSTKAAGAATPKSATVSGPMSTIQHATTQKLTQGERWTQNMSEDRIQRIVVSMIVVRTLAGGIDGFIDWPIVMSLFPNRTKNFVKSSWEALSNRHRSDIEALTEDLQRFYIEALEAGEAPSVNFEDVKATDWNTVVDWALQKLDRLSRPFHNLQQAADLPESREGLLETYDLAFDEIKRFHNVVSHASIVVKECATESSIFGISYLATKRPPSLQQPSKLEAMIADPILHTAKSWAFSAILTPPFAFKPNLAHEKLSTLASSPGESDRLLRQALKLLEDEKLIQRKPPKRQVSDLSAMRSWEAHPTLLSRFETLGLMSPPMLRSAREHKLDILDSAFAAGDTVMFEKEDIPQDGEVVAVLTLMSMGHVRARPGPDVPRTRYGIDHERVGYRARTMDKRLLGFGVEITPTVNYVLGDPMAQARLIPIPRGGADEERGTITPWVDIHGNVNMELWETFLSGVMGLVVRMPGISAADISKSFGLALEKVEVELMMSWAIQGGFLRRDGRTGGYLTKEWWWLCIDGIRDDDEA